MARYAQRSRPPFKASPMTRQSNGPCRQLTFGLDCGYFWTGIGLGRDCRGRLRPRPSEATWITVPDELPDRDPGNRGPANGPCIACPDPRAGGPGNATCCTRPLPWPIWPTCWKTTALCAHTKVFWSIWSTSAICKARGCICATEPSCRSARTQPAPCGKSIRSGGARRNGLLVRDSLSAALDVL